MSLVLDQIDSIILAKDDGHPYFNEVQRLRALAVGLHSLYSSVRAVEEKNAPPEGTRLFQHGNIPGVPLPQIECAFHWYSVSVCNFGRLIGWIGDREKIWRDRTGLKYVRRIMTPPYRYRNKVAAHFARYKPHSSDQAADLMQSVINFPALADGRFIVDALSIHMKTSGKSSTSTNTPWSLTELHEGLQARYGNDFQFIVQE